MQDYDKIRYGAAAGEMVYYSCKMRIGKKETDYGKTDWHRNGG